MTTPPEDSRWVDGTLESGADEPGPDRTAEERPTSADGSTEDPPLGATVEEGATTTFEPEEDPH